MFLIETRDELVEILGRMKEALCNTSYRHVLARDVLLKQHVQVDQW